MPSNRWIKVVVMAALLASMCCAVADGKRKRKIPSSLNFYFHEIRYDGTNMASSTSTLVANPFGNNLTILTGGTHYGGVVIFNNPLTTGPELNSTAIGRGQGLYLYDDKAKFNAWMAFTAVLDTADYNGTLTLMGADLAYLTTRDINVVGGTGDFVLARGLATVHTDYFSSVGKQDYYRLHFAVKLFM